MKEQIQTDNHMNTPELPIEKQEPPHSKCVNHDVQHPVDHPQSQADDFMKFLLRKNITLSRLYTFNDKPENYRT